MEENEEPELDDDSHGVAARPGRHLPPAPLPVAGRIAVVGPCAAGKTTLVRALCALGYDARHVAQEHSGVPDMWLRVAHPECLIYLDVSLEVIKRRRAVAHIASYFEIERTRLAHARGRCQIYVNTDELTPDQVLQRVLFLLSRVA